MGTNWENYVPTDDEFTRGECKGQNRSSFNLCKIDKEWGYYGKYALNEITLLPLGIRPKAINTQELPFVGIFGSFVI